MSPSKACYLLHQHKISEGKQVVFIAIITLACKSNLNGKLTITPRFCVHAFPKATISTTVLLSTVFPPGTH